MQSGGNLILITGGAGFIGSTLAEALLKDGNIVTTLDKLTSRRMQNISHLKKNPNFHLKSADMLDEKTLQKCVNHCDTVYHLSANADVRTGLDDPRKDFQQNITATHHLLEVMRKSPDCKRIVFTSSSTVYGSALITPTDEKYSPLYPISIYGASKLACEAMISGFCHMFDMSGVSARLANIIGPRSRRGVIYDFISKINADSSHLDVLGDGTQNKSYLYIDDCVNALMRIKNVDANYDVFNIGSDDQIKVFDIARIVAREMKMKSIDIRCKGSIDGTGWKGDVKEMLLDSAR